MCASTSHEEDGSEGGISRVLNAPRAVSCFSFQPWGDLVFHRQQVAARKPSALAIMQELLPGAPLEKLQLPSGPPCANL